MSVFISGYPHTIIHDPGDTLIPAPEDTGHWHCRGSRTPSHHPTPTSLYNSVSSEDVPMGGGGAPMHDCIGSLQYWVPLHWHCVSMIDIAASSPPRYCSTAALQHCRKFNECRYKIHSTLHSCTNIRLDWNPCTRANNVDR